MSLSIKEKLRLLSPEERERKIRSLSPEQAHALLSSWAFTARPEQLAPTTCDWKTWLILSGRGWGKSRCASEFVIGEVQAGRATRIALVGRTVSDLREVMVDGASGIMAVARLRGVQAKYEPSKRRITFASGAIATTYSSEEPSLLRGPEHDLFWCDELASWQMAKSVSGPNRARETFDNLMMGLRIGSNPRGIVTTTPRPVHLVRQLTADPKTHVTRGSTFDNEANLSASFIAEIKDKYEGTRVGRQEILGEILEDHLGALWTYDTIDLWRIKKDDLPQLARIVVAVDPATTSGENSDYTAISIAGLGIDGDFYALHCEQLKASPHVWASRVLELFDFYQADLIVAERNNGGDMVEHTIRTVRSTAPIKTIHASRGKQTRAEPVAALYEQGRVRHVGVLTELEDQMITFPVGAEHDDMVDALVYSITELDPSTQKRGGQLFAF